MESSILNFQGLYEKYGGAISKKQLTRLLNTRGCPVLPREKYQPYRVFEDEFDKWLRSRRTT